MCLPETMLDNHKKAQIMLITLLVLIILGILISGIVLVLRRDAEQTVANAKFEQLFNSAEGNLQSVVSDYGDYSVSLSSLTQRFSECTSIEENFEYECVFENDEYSSILTNTKLTIEDSRDVVEYEIQKDKTLALDIDNYKQEIEVIWDSNVAVEITLLYRDSLGSTRIIKDVFDRYNILESLNGDDPYTDPFNMHPFNFSAVTGQDQNRSFVVNLGSTIGLSASDSLLTILFTPRAFTSYASTRFSVRAINPSLFPHQMRVFTASSFDPSDGSSPVARLQTQVPLTPQIDGVFDYSLLTDSDIGL